MRGRRIAAPGLVAIVLATALMAPSAAAARPPRPPVVMIIFDEFPTDSLAGADGGLDAVRFPGFAELARGATWYRNAQSVADETMRSVPAILTSTPPRRKVGSTYRSYHHSVFTLLGARGYRIRSWDDDTNICPPRYCRQRRGLPAFPPVHERVDELSRALGSVRRTRHPTFTYVHTLLPHVPWHLTPSGQLRDPGAPGKPARILAGPFGFTDPFLTEQDEQRHLLQVGYVDRVVGGLVRRLRREGLYRRALVVVTADHGISFEYNVLNRRELRRNGGNVGEIAPVPLFVKAPGQTRGRTSRSYVRGTDVVPTMAHLLGLRLGWRAAGHAATSRIVRARRRLVISRPNAGFTLRVPAATVEKDRRTNVARRHRLFGTGPWRRVYRIGPNQQLLGLRPEQLPTAPAAGASARFDLPRSLARVHPTARIVPTWAQGSLAGPGAGRDGRRDLALAVNGRIRAVGRSVELSLFPTELFSLIFDQRYLRRGRNRVSLYEVRHSGPSLSLAPLGSR